MQPKNKTPRPQDELRPHLQFLVGCKEAAKSLGISLSGLYALLAKGVLPYRQLGGRRLIEIAALEKFVASLPKGEPRPQGTAEV